MSKPRAIVIIGDSFSNGDGVLYPNECIKHMGEDWVAECDALLHARATAQIIGRDTNPADDMLTQSMFETWMPRHINQNYSSKEFVERNGCWSKVTQRYADIPVVNLAIAGGSHESMINGLLYWISKEKFFVDNNDICVIANYTLPAIHRTSITTRWHYEPDNMPDPYVAKTARPNNYRGETIHYNPHSGHEFVDKWLLHTSGLHDHEYKFCNSLLMLQQICENNNMSFCWSGPSSDKQAILDWNFMELPLPYHRQISELEPAFTTVQDYTIHVCKDQIIHHGFNPYSICSHFNKPAQSVMGQCVAKLITDNTQWFWN